MTIYAEPGQRVQYLGGSGQSAYSGECDDATVLTPLEIYEVEAITIHGWHTAVTLKGVCGVYNSVVFEEVI